ncbi:MAG: TolC family protein [Pseudomonadota bacterium]
MFKSNIYVVIILSILAALSSRPALCQEYSLEDLYQIALERSERIKISEQDLFIAEKEKDRVIAVLWPKLSVFGSYTEFSESKETSPDMIIQPDRHSEWGIRLEKSFSLSGRELNALQGAKDGIESSRFDLSATREDYLFNVASAYYAVLRGKKAVDIAGASVERMIKQRDAAAARLKVGEVTKTAVLRAEAALSGARSELVKADNNLKLARTILARLAGLSDGFELKEAPSGIRKELPGVGEYKKDAANERADLKALEFRKRMAEERVKYSRGAYWPSLTVEGVYVGRDEAPSSFFINEESVYGGVSMNFPFFEGGLRRAEVKQAQARKSQAELALADLKKNVDTEVENAYLLFLTEKEVIKSLDDQLRFARDNYNAVSKQFEFGLADSIDVMDANTLLVTAERQLADSVYNYEFSMVRMQKAAGTLLKGIATKPPRH